MPPPFVSTKSEPLLPSSQRESVPELLRSSTAGVGSRWKSPAAVIRVAFLVTKKVAPPEYHGTPSFWTGSLKMLSGNKLFLGLVLVPIAFAAEPLGFPTSITFALTGLSMLPLAGLLGEATEQVALHTNEALSGLLNATFGNATELIISLCALHAGLLSVVSVSLLGSILSNTLLVLGCACLAGGLSKKTPCFNRTAAVSNATLLMIAILGLMVPTLLQSISQLKPEVDLPLSDGIAVLLLLLYGLYVYFQLFTHRDLFDEVPADAEPEVASKPSVSFSTFELSSNGGEEDEEEEVLLSLWGGVAWLFLATVLIAFLSEILTSVLSEAAETMGLGTRLRLGFLSRRL